MSELTLKTTGQRVLDVSVTNEHSPHRVPSGYRDVLIPHDGDWHHAAPTDPVGHVQRVRDDKLESVKRG